MTHSYDLDGDGYIDNVYVIYAGQGQASYGGTDTVWPHSSYITTGQSHDGKVLYRDGIYTTIDLERVVQNAEASVQKILSQL